MFKNYPPQEKAMIYNVYKEFIPKNNKWNTYIKSKNKEPNKELVEHLRDHLKCSSKESKEAIAMLDTTEISRILTNRGLDKKEIKTIIKMKQHLYKMLKTEAEAEKAKALLSLELLGNNAAGIGDHSTGDFYKNATESLSMLVDADDKLKALEKYFFIKGQVNG
jgi:hypothetical protein